MNFQSQKPALMKNRVFIINAKNCTHDELKNAFSECGTVTDVYQIKGKDIAYVTFSKVSHALNAIEMFHNKEINTASGKSSPIKVILASEKGEKNSIQFELNRLFIRVERDLTSENIKTEFSQFGQVDHIHILHDVNGKSKGLAYVTFIKPSEAARAIEECSSNFRAIFADNQERRVEKRQRPESLTDIVQDRRFNDQVERDIGLYNNHSYPNFDNSRELTTENSPMQILNQMQTCFSSDSNVLEVVVKNNSNVDMLIRLFSMVPGYQNIDTINGMMLVTYQNSKCASFALERLHGFEYPIGFWIKARFSNTNQPMVQSRFNEESYRSDDDMKMCHVTYCREMLPNKRPLANMSEDTVCRLFIVSNPTSFDEILLTDIFCRFGDCIDAYFLPNKNFGYVKYASKESAYNAIEMMNGKRIMGKILKVLEAEPPKENGDNKRSRTMSH